jgi:hypothetical protein
VSARRFPLAYAEAQTKPHVRAMDLTGRPMTGYVFVDIPGLEDYATLQPWIAAGRAFTDSLPAK